MLDDTIETLTEQLIEENFKNKGKEIDKYVISKEDLYKFCIKLIKVVKGIYEET